ncbi:hypothetical protein FQZ97_701550 [compost metagenome]
MQHGQQEGSGLARAGLARHHQVDETGRAGFAHGDRHDLFLHGGRLGETHVGHGGDQFGGKAQLDETVGRGRRFGFGGLGGCGVQCVEDRGLGHGFRDSGEFVMGSGLHRREFALRFKSVGHEYQSQTRALP